jgi:hypothetical protein
MPAPEPLCDVGPNAGTAIQRQDTIEIADEVAEMDKKRPQIHFRPDRGGGQGSKKHSRCQREMEALARNGLAIGAA